MLQSMAIFWELHSGLPQEGPGDNESTLKALRMIQDLPEDPQILDIGCGPGRQTIVLVKETHGTVIALDTHQLFLDEVEKRAKAENVDIKIITTKQSMADMDFEKQSFDVIWSEGAIFIIGFEKGLNYWKQFLKPGGYLVISELAWLIDDPPNEAETFFNEGYPDMKKIDENESIIKRSGYELIDRFVLPDTAWMDDYYIPIEKKLSILRGKYKGDKQAIKFLDASQEEIEIFRKYSNSYGYLFYVMHLPS